MPDRLNITPIPFGPGLARNEGSMVVREGALEDVRNWYLQDGRLQTRWGFDFVTDLPGELSESGTGDVTRILGGHALKSEKIGLIVGFTLATRRVGIWRVAGNGQNPEYLGLWFEHFEDTPPRVHITEVNGQVFFAHDEPIVSRRAQTIGYGGFGGSSLFLDGLTLDEGESEGTPIRFRGVVGHLDYLFGWGFGTALQDRPEMVRSSLPGQPTVFELNHYFVIGSRRDPVWRCVPGERDLICFKESDWHAIFGENRANFGSVRRDPLYGLLAPHLAVNVSGQVFFWSNEGPRMTDGFGPSVSLELPLDLPHFEPEDLVARGELRDSFAVYIPQDRMVWFVFGRRVYSLSVRRPGDWKWGYHELGFNPSCAFILWEPSEVGPGLAGPPTGYPQYTSASPSGSYADVTVTHVGAIGDEIMEGWIRVDDTDPWLRAFNEPIAPTATQVVRFEDLDPGVTYDVAFRYVRGGQVADAYLDSKPENWPSVSQGEFTTTLDPPLVGVFDATLGWRFPSPSTDDSLFAFERLSSTLSDVVLRFRIFPTSESAGHTIKVYRRPSGGSDTLIATLVEGVDFDLGSLDADGGFLYTDTGAGSFLEQVLYYRATTTDGGPESPKSDSLRLWVGPLPSGALGGANSPPANASIFFEAGNGEYEVTATIHELQDATGADTNNIRLYDNWDDVNEVFLANPTEFRDEVEFSGDLTPAEEGPPTFGKTAVAAKLQSGALTNPVPSGSGFKYRVVFSAERDTQEDPTEGKVYSVAVP